MTKFLNGPIPLLTAMIYEKTTDGLIASMKKTADQGAEAFCLLAQGLEAQYKTKENFRKIIDCAGERKVYITNYVRTSSQPDLTDDCLANQLLEMAESGAALIDVRTDMFCRADDEVTRDFHAVEKQKNLISEIHKLGAEVLMSTHIFEYRTPENILEIAKLQQQRGADIAKIVTEANSEKELTDAFKTNILLKTELNIPHLFLCNGTHCNRHRLLAPFMGTSFFLCVENSRTQENQPTIEKAKRLREEILAREEKK